MTYRQLNKILKNLNLNKTDEYIFRRPLNDKIDFAYVWTENVNPITKEKSWYPPEPFYFIKNSEDVYVACVSDLTNDLHWYVLPKYRGKGFLTSALKSTILPHIFQDNREEQRITIDEFKIGSKNYSASLKVAKNVGFIEKSNFSDITELFLKSIHYNDVDYIDGKNTKTDFDRINILKRRADNSIDELLKIQSELEIRFGKKDCVEEIKEIVEYSKNIIRLIEDSYSIR